MRELAQTTSSITIVPKQPDLASFKRLRAETSWGVPEDALLTQGLNNGLFCAVAMQQSEIIGMIRVIGDGALQIYIQDVIVIERLRSHGIGRRLVETAIIWMRDNMPADISVGLMAADGQSGFYEAFGFISRPGAEFGPGMQTTLSRLTPHSCKQSAADAGLDLAAPAQSA